MKILKNLALSLLSFLLFLSLSIFGFAFLLNQTILNPNFITSELDRLDVSSLTEEIISEQVPEEDFSEESRTTVINAITNLEPLIKEQVSTVIDSVSDYLLGKSEGLDLALVLGETFLNSDFVVSLVDELDIPALAKEIISQQMSEEDFSEESRTALVNTITELEPLIKEQVGAATDPVFDYLLGKSESIDLAHTLRNTILNADFIISLVDELDISSLASEFAGEQLTGVIPEEMEFLTEHLDNAIAELEPTIKEELTAAADPLLDYLLGESQSLSIVISLEPVMESLKDTLREAFLESLPPEYAGLPQHELDQRFEEYFTEFIEIIPATFEIDESLLGTEIPTQIDEALAEAEKALEQARQDITEGLAEAEEALVEVKPYIGYFQLGYKVLIGFMVLLVLGIILINRQVRDTTRGLGITFLTYGAFEYAGIFVAKYFAESQLTLPEIPAPLQTWITQLIDNFLAPLQMFSLGLLIGGIALIIVSFVYKPRQASS